MRAPLKVLIVENDAVACRFATQAINGIEQFRVEWTATQTLAESLSFLATNEVDVILYDLTLPNGSGKAAFDRLMASVGNAKVIVLTASDDPDLRQHCLSHGAEQFIEKGAVSVQLREAITKVRALLEMK